MLFNNIKQIEIIKTKKLKKLVYIFKRINNLESYKMDVNHINKKKGLK